MEKVQLVVSFLLAHKMLFTTLILIAAWLTRRTILSMIRGDHTLLSEKQRSWMSRTKNGTFTITLLVLFVLWQSEISEFALSVTAIAVAIVVASKEIILCFTGSIQRASSRSFRVGDWIEVGKLCGEVIDHNMMATVIQEIDLHHGQYHYTGKTATLPNSMFFTYPVKNLNFMKRYVYHNFSVVVRDFVNLYPLLTPLTEKIDEHCSYFSDVAHRYNAMIEKHAGVDLPGAEPHIHISSNATGEQIVHVMIFCPTDKANHLEHLIRQDFMDLYEQRFPVETQ
ncbi:mechanosensitive ion channel family protein [Vibrio natriegens]|uniref:Mechanosensitive ion channel protein MscS n=1 Tax=Vibrio natriegens NBRC 15636 = ATCC 14048 = DSM 759 TaxID=1219067 RepID=A0AAN0Y732_VIBNA|nr:mechanosensitive ion channel domain-containing protein [Vibrio natriegens]ALR17331.1 mechanosensitive ion channel protein MscS [Vibrio natriegens NBRC 15636 = ATCC 14048 = DSM 759]ANQ14822.1 mechanosensitive ion channel protein MscS [Vibrio natriegens NBRC 15636 = ATCC 14048 = DSM 759]EPM39875.1 small mechanosensitive ion channel protein MscS [Vibrio natriegens NBRC 15636 = ATCC 14048 = DSM 759]MDX6029858.1 mechanosensitive ion channel family protein [Vibrio natriegens NBRC 15636 = ATCC 1404